jgi:pimeloyl-ACP methyl ester carboxylesterase
LRAAGDPRCADHYFQAAVCSWQAMSQQSTPLGPGSGAGQTYQASLQGLLDAAMRYGRWQGALGIRVYQPDGPLDLPLANDGGAWPVNQLRELHLTARPQWPQLKAYYHSPGFGVPAVAVRYRLPDPADVSQERFFPARLPLSATFLLRPRIHPDPVAGPPSAACFELALVNPIAIDTVQIGDQSAPLARDLSAAIEYQLSQRPNDPWSGFLTPARVDEAGLRFLEPYQPGKIPLIFVHGLISDPTVWSEIVNHLRAQTWFNQHYQVWGFNYATGSPFVTSAMQLRHQVNEALMRLDPNAEDPALQQMVLVGHSMGGLVAKLQVTDSGDRLWSSVAHVPLAALQATAEAKNELAQRLYFCAQPNVRRVIYIATPHAGSSLAARGVGRLSSALIRPDESMQGRHAMLVRDNPEAFTPTFRRRIPTSIDLLEPNDPTLQAIYHLPVAPHVTQHTILGTGATPLPLNRGDGVVLVPSAGHPDATSEHHVAAGHTGILDREETTQEIIRILRLHLQE